MRLLYIDIDTLRADHVGCYGYGRNTTPNIDRLAGEGIRFDRCYVSDAPCLPSRTALFSGRFGVHTGVVSHGGTAADFLVEGPSRGFISRLTMTSWPGRMRRAGLHTATISSFGERHSAWHWYAGFKEVFNPGTFGLERADQVATMAIDWLRRRGDADDWFLHVHLWDPHTPYRAPADYGEPFRDEALPTWLTEEVRSRHWEGCGPHSAREVIGFDRQAGWAQMFPRQPIEMESMDSVRKMFDGYDTGVRYADDHVGRILNVLADLGVLEDTAVMVSADHGETLGELNVYCDHHTADQHTSRVPMVLRWPNSEPWGRGRIEAASHYQCDVAATVLELLGARVPSNWDGRSFATSLREGRDEGREFLVLSQGAWTCQRSVLQGSSLCIRTYHDGYHGFPETLLFDLVDDPHEQENLAEQRPEIVSRCLGQLEAWHQEMMRDHPNGVDPMSTVMLEGGPWHVRGHLRDYLERLRATERSVWADRLAKAHPSAA